MIPLFKPWIVSLGKQISNKCSTLRATYVISNKIDREVGCEQVGFRKKSGTREAIFYLKVITEKYIEMGKELYACFIDYSKAFDTVNHEQLISSLSGTEVDDNNIAVIAHLYWLQITRIHKGSDLTEPVKIKRGVRQGCVLSPICSTSTQSTYSERQIISLGWR